jgi:uncharacterized membrane protein YphA (DoxX/SURF4 family)
MNLVRFAGRIAFSAFFVAEGYQAFTKPQEHLGNGSQTLDELLPKATQILPESVSAKIPTDQQTLTRVIGGTEMFAGIAYGIGFARRPAALALAGATLPSALASLGEVKLRDVLHGKNIMPALQRVALVGAAVVATQDTNGRPSITWQASRALQTLTSGSRNEDSPRRRSN